MMTKTFTTAEILQLRGLASTLDDDDRAYWLSHLTTH